MVLQLQYRSAGHLLVNYCTNLSRGGVFIPSASPLPAGTPLQLELSIPGDTHPTQLDAEVRWVRQFDAAQGPAGMGLAFRDIGSRLGQRIDMLVADFEPLRVFVVSRHEGLRGALASQIRTLVRCETSQFESPVGLLDETADADLVVVDANTVPDEALSFLHALMTLQRPPPRVALCEGTAAERRARLEPLARVVDSPVDPTVLREVVLDTLSIVHAQSKRADEV